LYGSYIVRENEYFFHRVRDILYHKWGLSGCV
jgi:hypothetical protein